jgi:Tol biopolymer transport system component
MRYINRLACFVLAGILSGCVSNLTPTIVPEITTPKAQPETPLATITTIASPTTTLPKAATSTPFPTATSFPPTNTPIPARIEGEIVFYSERDGDAEIYLMNPDGSNQRPLTDNRADDFSPAWSPDGKLIAFESDRDDANPRICFPNCNYNLYVMNADGSNPRQLTALSGAEWNVHWSPDGLSLLFTARNIEGENAGIYRIRLEGGDPQPLLVDTYDNNAADWSPDGSQITFSSNREGNLDIFIMNSNGSNIVKVIDTGMDDYFPEWSPDGKQITFFAADWPTIKQDIFTVSIDGSNLQNLTNTPGVVDEDPKWSLDGSKIIYQSDRDGNFEIYMMNSDGSQSHNLTNSPGQDYWPDLFMIPSKEIAFVSDRSGRSQIYLIPAPGEEIPEPIDSNALTLLTNNQYENYFPSWSPDGIKIAYYTHLSWQNWAIVVMNTDGSQPYQLTKSDGDTTCSFGPVWSPDGERIAFNVEPNPIPTCEIKHTGIAVIDINSGEVNFLTHNEANNIVGSWSPDGRQLIFTSDRDGKNEVYVMNADGSDQQRLTELDSNNSMPVYSPDGKFIAFVSNRDGNDEIYIMDSDGSNLRRITNNPNSDWQPSWSADSQRIVFISGTIGSGFDLFVINGDGSNLRQLTDFPGWEYEPAWQP